MRKAAGVEFYIYSPARLFELVGKQPEVKVAPSSIDDAQKVTEELQARSAEVRLAQPAPGSPEPTWSGSRWSSVDVVEFSRRAVGAVRRWLVATGVDVLVEETRRQRTDLTLVSAGKRTGVEVATIRHPRSFVLRNRVSESGFRAHYALTTGEFDEYLLVVVAPEEETAMAYVDLAFNRRPPKPPHPAIVVGVVEEGENFRPLWELPPRMR